MCTDEKRKLGVKNTFVIKMAKSGQNAE